MSVLITGAGLVGCFVAARLIAQGEQPILFDAVPPVSYIDGIVGRGKGKVIKGNLLNFTDLIEAADKVDGIVHTAALLGLGMGGKPYDGVKVNVEGTLNVLETARLLGLRRVVFCSTQAVYDFPHISPDARVTEDDPARPPTLYAATKLAAEMIGLRYHDLYGVDFIALRFASIYGPRALGSRRSLNAVLEPALKGKPVVAERPAAFEVTEHVYVKDVAAALVQALRIQRPQNRIFNIGSGSVEHWMEMMELIRRLIPDARIEARIVGHDKSEYGSFVRSQPMDISLAQAELGYQPTYDLEAGLTDYITTLRRFMTE